ncbi:MAG: aminotransferase class I/II-fold pyridoxal phosphate-dependent enzyme, partial [Candidatus Aminicenantes bacterium]|nr:aminotransferase class I/II-fold pyridoxal phosphate-dependent enzyme [Candidatus Aminicenantes bacterium]
NVFYLKKAFRSLGFDINDTPVPIICLSFKKLDMQAFQAKLFAEGIAVHYMPGGSYSNLPPGGAVRIAVFSTHTKEQIDRLVSAIKHYI